MKNDTANKLKLSLAMLIFGTIGLFVKSISLPSSVIAMVRGLVGGIFLIVFIAITKKGFSFESVKKNALILFISGAAIGFNWILLFESYRYTTVAVSTLCYYMSPVFVIVLSPIILKEKLTLKKIICVAVAFLGMVFVSGVMSGGSVGAPLGIALGLGAAVLYATVIFLNKFLHDIGSMESTIVQLITASVVTIPYVFLTENVSELSFDRKSLILLFTVAVIHTGLAYSLYFGSFEKIPGQTVALFGYIDPAFAIILSTLILREKIDIFGIIGAVLILGSTLFCELSGDKE